MGEMLIAELHKIHDDQQHPAISQEMDSPSQGCRYASFMQICWMIRLGYFHGPSIPSFSSENNTLDKFKFPIYPWFCKESKMENETSGSVRSFFFLFFA